jgi:hypothetical protein
LHQQALDAGIDEAGAELGEVENSDDQREQAGDVEKDDAPGQAGKGDADEEMPALIQQLDEPPASLGERRLAGVGPVRLDVGPETLRRSIEHAGLPVARPQSKLCRRQHQRSGSVDMVQRRAPPGTTSP